MFLTFVVIYLAIMAQRLRKVSAQADDIEARLDRQDAARAEAAAPAASVAAAGSSAAGAGAAKTPEGVA